MSIIDRYIIKKFLVTFFFIMLIIMMLAVIFDVSERLSEFLEKGASVYDIVFGYYVNFILFYGNMFSALIVFISVIWFTGKMAQNTEIIPILNSGRGFVRFMRPYFMGATVLTLLSLLLNNFILPDANKRRLEFEEKFYRVRMVNNDYHAEISDNELLFFDHFNSDEKKVRNFMYENWNGNQLVSVLKAGVAASDSSHNWKLSNVDIRYVLEESDSLVHIEEMDTVFNFSMWDFARRMNVVEAMDYNELNEFIETERQRGSKYVASFEVHKYQRFSYPFATYVLVLIGVAVSSRKTRGGIGVQIAIGLVVVLSYILSMKFFTVAAENVGMPPMIAVWSSNILFGLLAIVLIIRAPK